MLDPITGEVIKAGKTTAVRSERGRPGELVHTDVKKLGRIPDGSGWRAHGRGAGSLRRDRSTTVGFDYIHSLVDDHSRLAYSEIPPHEKGARLFLSPATARTHVSHAMVKLGARDRAQLVVSPTRPD